MPAKKTKPTSAVVIKFSGRILVTVKGEEVVNAAINSGLTIDPENAEETFKAMEGPARDLIVAIMPAVAQAMEDAKTKKTRRPGKTTDEQAAEDFLRALGVDLSKL